MNKIPSLFRPSRFLPALGVIVAVLLGFFWARHVGVKSQHEAGHADSPPKVAREAVNPARPGASNSGVSSLQAPVDQQRRASTGLPQASKRVPQVAPIPILKDAPPEFLKFDEWTARYAAADAADRDGLISEGVVLAKARRAGMRRVIQRDPRRALEWALPERLRQLLPREVLAHMEVRVNARGEFSVASAACEHRSEVSGSCCSEVRLVRLASGERYIASVYGRGLSRSGSSEAHVNGVALEGRIALDERPFRVLEAGESPDPSKPALKVCPVSGTSESVAAIDGSLPVVTAKTPAYEMGGVTYYPCEPGHMALAL
jgi:hypothetical protein